MKNFLLLFIVISLAGCGETKAEQAADKLAAAQKQALDEATTGLKNLKIPPDLTSSPQKNTNWNMYSNKK